MNNPHILAGTSLLAMNEQKHNFFAVNLRKLRGARSQQEMADLLGFKSYQAYQRYESGVVPSHRKLMRIASKLKVSPQDLLYAELSITATRESTKESTRESFKVTVRGRSGGNVSGNESVSSALPWTASQRLEIETMAYEADLPVEEFIVKCMSMYASDCSRELVRRRGLMAGGIVRKNTATNPFSWSHLPTSDTYNLFAKSLPVGVPEESEPEPVAESKPEMPDLDVPAPAPPPFKKPTAGLPTESTRFLATSLETWADSLIRSLNHAPKDHRTGGVKGRAHEYYDQILNFFNRVDELDVLTGRLEEKCTHLFHLSEKHLALWFTDAKGDINPSRKLRSMFQKLLSDSPKRQAA